jgi:phytoene dehydrogenase-like protein
MAVMKRVIIIGAGIAGLSTGIMAQQNGFQAEIFEMHNLPGGLCTAWKRKGYTFDGCVRYVYGSGEGRMLHPLMRRIGAAGARPYVHHGESIRVETSKGRTVVFHCDLDRLREHLQETGPEDAAQIRRLVRAAKSMSRAAMPPGAPSNAKEMREFAKAIVRFVPHVVGNARTSLLGFASSLKNTSLREAFLHYYGYAELDNLPLFVLLMDLAEHHAGNAGWPMGGSLALARDVADRFESRGGKIHYGCRVTNILTDNGAAAGVRLADGSEFSADSIVSAADAHATLESMLGGRFTPQVYRDAFQNEKLITPLVQVSLGIDMNLEGIPHNQAVFLPEPLTVAGRSYEWLSFKHYGYDPSMAPAGKSAVVAVLETSYDTWAGLAEDRVRYAEEKETAADRVIALLDRRYPGLKARVEACDVATPVTWKRYTGNRRGSPQGWQAAVGNFGSFPGWFPELKNFYMAGQWVQRGGGIPGGAISAMGAVKRMCKDNRVHFR